MEFFKRYEQLCNQSNKTPTGVALEIGSSRASVNRWRNGGSPNPETVSKIADYFSVSTDYLLGNTDIKNPPSQQGPEDIAKVALFGGDNEVTDEMWQEVKDYVNYIKQKHNKD